MYQHLQKEYMPSFSERLLLLIVSSHLSHVLISRITWLTDLIGRLVVSDVGGTEGYKRTSQTQQTPDAITVLF